MTIEQVRNYYGKVLQTQKDLKTSACTAAAAQRPAYLKTALSKVPDEVMIKFYGCGCPFPVGMEGLSVLDLGCGSGRDCFVAAQLVGPEGTIIGLDMTEEQLKVARGNVDNFASIIGRKPQMEFVMGYIEDLESAGIKADSVDLVISNCVLNLSPRKDSVLKQVWNVLREGGEFYFSDVYADRRLSEAARKDEVLWGECVSGALYIGDFIDIAKSIGFVDIRMVAKSPISIQEDFRDVLGEAQFFSITYRLFKLSSLETRCEDYGQIAIYHGTIPHSAHSFSLDIDHKFLTNKPVLVCGNTASMLSESYLKPHFKIIGDRSIHYGEFQCGNSSSVVASTTATTASSSCCS